MNSFSHSWASLYLPVSRSSIARENSFRFEFLVSKLESTAFNRSSDEKLIIPYNENRVVLFNSNLIHETDKYEFKEGYENRRINVTMLFGRRGT